ncbi:MAG: efflux RND transporter permease subunit, partial [Planctomycetota bacterium]
FSLLGMTVGVVVGGISWIGSAFARLALWPVSALFQRAYSAVERAYVPFLQRCLHARTIVLAAALLALVIAGWRATTLSPDLIPESLTGEFDVKISFPPGTPIEQTAARVRPAEERVRALEAVAWTALTAGVEADADRAADEGEHTAKLTVHLADAGRGPEHERAVRREVESILRSMPGAQPPEVLPSTLFRFALPLNIVFFGSGERDLVRIAEAADQTARQVRTLPGVGSVRVGHGRGAREVRLKFDRDALFRFGVTAEEVARRVQAKLQGRVPTALVEGSERTDIRVRVAEEDRGSVRDLLELDVASAGQRPLPLRMVLLGRPLVAEGPGEVRRVGGRHAATVEADYEGLQLDRVSAAAADIANPIASQLDVDVEVLGRSQEAARSNRALLYALLLAVFLVYAVMAAQFESLIQPILIMVSLPLAGVGAILLLDALALPLSVVVMLGAILLVGIAVNNAIVLVDRMNQQLALTPTVREAILAAARERLRPILMTTLTTVLGLLPLTGMFGVGSGEAAELRAPMAWTVIGGLLTSTLLTLVVVPVLYDVAGGRRASACRRTSVAFSRGRSASSSHRSP